MIKLDDSLPAFSWPSFKSNFKNLWKAQQWGDHWTTRWDGTKNKAPNKFFHSTYIKLLDRNGNQGLIKGTPRKESSKKKKGLKGRT